MVDAGRILLADDEETFLLSTAELLRREGFHCDCARNAETVRAMLRVNQYDLLISDIKMPGNVELDLIRDLPRLAEGLPVILVTGYPSLHTALKSIQMPVVAYLPKPIDFGMLLSHVRSAVQRVRTYRAVSNTRQRLQNWNVQIEDIEKLNATQRQSPLVDTVTFLTLTLRNIVESLADVKTLIEVLAQNRVEQDVCHLVNCPKPAMFISALNETIAVLEKTKSSFKSKELGELREKLEQLVQNATSPEMKNNHTS